MMITRYDSVQIPGLHVDKQTGFIHAKNVPITRTGVFPYLKSDGSLDMEAKLPEEVLSDSTVESANNKVITDDHPHELVTEENSDKYLKGFTANNAHVENGQIKVDMTITNHDLIKKISENDKRELSIGFETELVPEKGEYNGQKYDSVQRNIQINHVAVVEQGRAGHAVRLVGDSAEMVSPDFKEKGSSMELKTVYLGDSAVKVAKEDADVVSKVYEDAKEEAKSNDEKIADYKKQIANLESKIKELQGSSDKAKEDADKAQAKADSAEKILDKYKKKYEGDGFNKAVEETIKLREDVKPYLPKDYDFNGKTKRQLELDAMQVLDSSFEGKDKSDEFIDTYFNAYKKAQEQMTPTAGFLGDSAPVNDTKEDMNQLRMNGYNLVNNGKEDK